MNRSMFVLAALVLGLVLPAAALAKGPSAATISGDVLKNAITISGDGETDQTPLGQLTMQAGFFPAAFGQSPDPMLPKRPTGALGSALNIHYTVPGGDNQTFYIDQIAYPYAKGGALTYMKPGQPIFDMATRGGWYRAYGLRRTLVKLGAPATTARTARSTSSKLVLIAGIGIPGALVLAGTALFLRRRKS